MRKTELELEIEITEMMREIGIPAHLKGYYYIRTAVVMALKDIEIVSSVTKLLYPDVARRYDTTGEKVERAIRNAIEVAFNRDPEAFNAFFHVSCWKTRPTNSEFLATCADRIRLKE